MTGMGSISVMHSIAVADATCVGAAVVVAAADKGLFCIFLKN